MTFHQLTLVIVCSVIINENTILPIQARSITSRQNGETAAVDASKFGENPLAAGNSHLITNNTNENSQLQNASQSDYVRYIRVRPSEYGVIEGLHEGDIAHVALNGNGMVKAWPNGIIPYELGPEFEGFDRQRVLNAINVFNAQTCIKFVQRTYENDYAFIRGGYGGCYSGVGHHTGAQHVNLEIPGCVQEIGTILHELMHVVGFYHEQSRPDRADYVRIFLPSIHPNNYEQFTTQYQDTYGLEYDYDSIMHYDLYAFSWTGWRTIVPRRNYNGKIGQRRGLSPSDIKKVERMYRCGAAVNEYWPRVFPRSPPPPCRELRNSQDRAICNMADLVENTLGMRLT